MLYTLCITFLLIKNNKLGGFMNGISKAARIAQKYHDKNQNTIATTKTIENDKNQLEADNNDLNARLDLLKKELLAEKAMSELKSVGDDSNNDKYLSFCKIINVENDGGTFALVDSENDLLSNPNLGDKHSEALKEAHNYCVRNIYLRAKSYDQKIAVFLEESEINNIDHSISTPEWTHDDMENYCSTISGGTITDGSCATDVVA